MTKEQEKYCNNLTEIKLLLRNIAGKLDIDPAIIADASNFDTVLDTLIHKEVNLHTLVGDILKELGASCHILGYKYACDAIIYIFNNSDKKISITKELYPIIAKLHHTTPSRVERAIRHLIETIWSRGNIEYINQLFSYSVSALKGKPTNSEFLYTISDKLRLILKSS